VTVPSADSATVPGSSGDLRLVAEVECDEYAVGFPSSQAVIFNRALGDIAAGGR
jgi:hypothetical protein